MSASHVFRWIFDALKWDGLLPAIVWSVPMLIRWLLPNQRGPVEIAAVVLPIFAIVFRFYVGRKMIFNNNCGKAMRYVQMLALCVGIFFFFVVDALMILALIMPQGPPTPDGVLIGVFLSYFIIMLIATYPGPETHEAEPMRD